MWDLAMAANAVPDGLSGRRCVGRSKEAARVSAALTGAASGVVIITGEPGMGRTTFVGLVLKGLDPSRNALLRVRSDAGGTPLAALRPYLRGDPAVPGPWARTAAAAAAQLAERVGGRRPVVVADDAHRMDLTSMLVLRQLQRAHGAVLLLTTPRSVPAPDPTDCVRYEPNVLVVDLPPLTRADVTGVLADMFGGAVRRSTAAALHVMSGGNPERLRRLLAHRTATIATDRGCEQRRPGPPADGLPGCSAIDLSVMQAAMAQAWAALDLDTVIEIGQLMQDLGAEARVTAMHAGALLLRGWPAEAERLLAQWAPEAVDDEVACRLVVTRALTHALGLGNTAEAVRLLTFSAERAVPQRTRLLAYRAWLQALDGQVADALRGAEAVTRAGDDHEAQLLARTALGTVAMTAGRPGAAVASLRRAVAMVERSRDELPWLPPYLTGCLIEALLRAGRGREAASLASEFQSGRTGREDGVLSISAGRWRPATGHWQLSGGGHPSGDSDRERVATGRMMRRAG